MKQTNRIHPETTAQTPAPQAEKPANGGQNNTPPGQEPPAPAPAYTLADSLSLLEEAHLKAKTFQMLMFDSIQNEDVKVWKRDNGYLVAGLQTFILEIQESLDYADDLVRQNVRILQRSR